MRALIEWSAYALEVGLLFGAAAWVASVACRAVRVPERWVWVSALLFAPLVPVLAYVMPEAPLSAGVARVGSVVPVLSLEAPLASSTGALSSVGGVPWVAVALYLWFVASVVLSARFLSAAGRLRTARAGWPFDAVDGHVVLRSANTGPAVVGVVEPAIVLPAWVFGLDHGIRRLMLKHEREHIAARDPLLLAIARLMIVLTPWNPVTWWMARRLALAIEMDCDARVMRDERDTNLYGVALFEAGRRRSVLAPAFSERVSWLERRMSNILGPNPRRPGKGLLLGASAVAVAGLAMCVEAPREPTVTEPMEAAEVEAPAPERAELPPPPRAGERNLVEEMPAPVVDSEVDPSVAPVFVPYESPPQLTNVNEVQRELESRYPVLLRNAGIGGTALVWFYVNEAGVVANTQLKESSGYPTMDAVALRVAEMMRFRPAQNRGESVAVWVAIPIDFSTGGRPSPDDSEEPDQIALNSQSSDAGIERVAGNPPPAAAALAQLADRPVMVEYETPPTLESEGNARAHLQRYPMAVDETREATIWMLVGTDGQVHDARLKDTSGSAGFDEAALAAAREMRFSPALIGGEPISVWVEVPIEASRTE